MTENLKIKIAEKREEICNWPLHKSNPDDIVCNFTYYSACPRDCCFNCEYKVDCKGRCPELDEYYSKLQSKTLV